MSSGSSLGLFTGSLFGDPQSAARLNRLNYQLLKSLTRDARYDRERVSEIYRQNQVPVGTDQGHSSMSLSRMMPLALLNSYDPVITDTNLTNPNPVNQDAGLLYVHALKLLRTNSDPRDVFLTLVSSAQGPEIKSLLQSVAQGLVIDVPQTEATLGSIYSTFYVSIMALLHSGTIFPSWTAAIEWVVSLGGDVTTNAALAGALVGAYFGSERLFDEPAFANLQMDLLANFDDLYEVSQTAVSLNPDFASPVSQNLFTSYQRTLAELRKSTWNQFETRHDFIQIIFPTTGPGVANRELTLTPVEISELTDNPIFIEMLREAFNLMMSFYGLALEQNRLLIIDPKRYYQYFVTGGAGRHNHRRITRILTSLRLFQQHDLYLALKELALTAARGYHSEIPGLTLRIWTDA